MQQFNKAWLIAIALLLSIGSYLFLYNPQPIPLKRDLKGIADCHWRLEISKYKISEGSFLRFRALILK